MTTSDSLVLIDFYAEWCGPCKKMEPYLKEIAVDMKDRVKVIRLDVDANQQLAKELNIEELPILHLYKNKELVWSNKGYIGKEEVLKKLNKELSI
ncbi:thioredoxin family protein [Niabella ginsengisoli]|uniref:Thioredoxin family protein n=1 Tax=Niabella ginsengisoli TaxID=522298 RepID=A0ABS9SPJ4_9BACT|nr:thioredoxin family protein [Niabella ginsengisoli]MCH5600292.1 thioredoxin family protein [Niabella ginsengisoli]